MRHRFRFGPLAVFIMIITIILTMIALLNFSTANADVRLAQRYAKVTQTKYQLEKMGSEFIAELGKDLADGSFSAQDDIIQNDNGIYTHTEQLDEYTLTIDFSISNNTYKIKRWQIDREWEESSPMEDIWQP